MGQIWICGSCRKRAPPRAAKAGGLCPVCFVPDLRLEVEQDPEPRRGSSAVVETLEDVEDLALLPCSAPLVACLGGVEEAALLVVSGEPGQGKSTECARVAVALNEPPAYLDAEMSSARCAVVLRDAGASPRFLAHTARITAEHWSEAFDVARNRRIWIVDSATAWAGPADEGEFVDALVDAAEDGRIILAIQQWTRQGRAHGKLGLEHRGDVTLDVMETEFIVRKARWGQKGTYPRPRIITARMKRQAPRQVA